MKKIAIIGKGTAGALSALQIYNKIIHHETSSIKFNIDWYFDPEIPTQAVGEGTNLIVPNLLRNSGFTWSDLYKLDGTYKEGISKKNWTDKQYFHRFHPPNISVHLNALKLQDFAFNALKDKKYVNIINKNVSANEVDADLVIDCSGKPKNLNQDFVISDYIPVNSVYVTQCYWDSPKFQYSLTDAMQHGWIFGIPLQNRCSIGYLYNNKFATLEQVKEDVKNVFDFYKLTPSNTTNHFSFNSYYRKNNFVDNIAYNGNASFFLEPLEASTLGQVVVNADYAYSLFEKNFSLSKRNEVEQRYKFDLESTTTMIMLHYYAGSIFKNPFWAFAEQRAKNCIQTSLINDARFRKMIKTVFQSIKHYKGLGNIALHTDITKNISSEFSKNIKSLQNINFKSIDYGTWHPLAWQSNILDLNVEYKLKKLVDNILKK